jgi:hypothetical protein
MYGMSGVIRGVQALNKKLNKKERESLARKQFEAMLDRMGYTQEVEATMNSF